MTGEPDIRHSGSASFMLIGGRNSGEFTAAPA
jgi:hypothetical protein